MKKSFKSNKTIICSFIVLAIFIIPITCFSYPVYVVNPIIGKTNVNPNESIEIRIYIAGEGDISNNRLLIYSDKSVLFSDELFKNKAGYLFKTFDDKLFNEKIERAEGFKLSQAETGITEENPLEESSGSKAYIAHPIYTINTISKAPGDHELRFVFIYSGDGNQYFIDEKEIKFHIKSWFERHETGINIIIIFIAALGLFFNKEIKNLIKKLTKREKNQTQQKLEDWEKIKTWFKIILINSK